MENKKRDCKSKEFDLGGEAIFSRNPLNGEYYAILDLVVKGRREDRPLGQTVSVTEEEYKKLTDNGKRKRVRVVGTLESVAGG